MWYCLGVKSETREGEEKERKQMINFQKNTVREATSLNTDMQNAHVNQDLRVGGALDVEPVNPELRVADRENRG